VADDHVRWSTPVSRSDYDRLLAELARVEASRRDWAAEAMGLQAGMDVLVLGTATAPALPPLADAPCACVTDEQAAQLGPGFTRPQCAMHPAPTASGGTDQ
jgi:hypothetical protein